MTGSADVLRLAYRVRRLAVCVVAAGALNLWFVHGSDPLLVWVSRVAFVVMLVALWLAMVNVSRARALHDDERATS